MKKTFLLITALCLALCGCVTQKTSATDTLSGEMKMEAYLETLYSEEFEGRLPGHTRK